MTRLGIIGHPVAHSLSPAMQGAALRARGIDARYEAWDTPPDVLAERVASLREPGSLGANVTIPHKVAVLPLLDEVDPLARAIGAVNTIVNRDGRLAGHNTDAPGFVAALRADAGFGPQGRSFLLLGAGGAARGIAFGLAEAGAARIAIANRTAARASTLAAETARFSPDCKVEAVAWGGSAAGYDCIVNCTSIGMEGTGTEAEAPCDVASASPGTLVVDIVYAPAETTALAAAKAAGLRVLGGLPMLVHQGALSFTLWTGAEAPVEVMRAAAETALAERTGAQAR